MRCDRLVLIGIVLVLPVAFWTGSTSYDGVKFTLLALAGACWLGHLAWRLGARRSIPRPAGGLLAAGAALLGVLAVSSLQAHHGALVWRTALLTALWLAVVLTTSVTIDTPRRMHTVLAAAVASAAAACLYGLAQIAGLLPGAPLASGYPAGISTLGNQNYLSGLAAVLLGPSVILWRRPSTIRRIGAAAATLVLGAAIILARAAGPAAGILGSALVMGPAAALVRRGRAPKVPLILGACVLLAVTAGSAFLVEAMRSPLPEAGDRLSFQQRVFRDNHGAVRRTDWLVAREMFRTRPWTGQGAGNYPALWPATRAALAKDDRLSGLADRESTAAQAHNEGLQFLGETGMIGAAWLLICLLAGAGAWRRRWHGLTDARLRTDFLLLTAGLLTAGIHSQVSFPLHLPASALMLAVMIGLLACPVFGPPDQRPATWSGKRGLALLPAICAVALAAGALREFAGDLDIARGERFFAAGLMEQAAPPLEKGVHRSRWPGRGHLYLGLVRIAAGDRPGGRIALENGVREKPTFEGYLALAELSIDQDRFAEAEQYLTLVENCRPYLDFRAQAAYLRGLAAQRQGRTEEARRRWGDLLKTDPDNQRAWLALGYQEVLAGKRDQARICYGRALEIIDRKLGAVPAGSRASTLGARTRLLHHRETARKALDSLAGP